MIEIWNTLFLEPMLNSLVVLYRVLFQNFGVAILVFTVLIRLIMFPLTLRQLKVSKAMAELGPLLQEIKKKYKDPQRQMQEQQKLYKEKGVSPLGCLGPTLIQFPIWIGLYQSIIQALAATPEGLLGLSQRLYPWYWIQEAVPLRSDFLWLNLAQPDPFPIMAVLVAASTWVTQKMMTTMSADPRTASMNRTMLYIMPIMLGFWTLYFPSGLALYWVSSNLIGIAIQYRITGWGGLTWPTFRRRPPSPPEKGSTSDGQPGVDRQDSGRGRGAGTAEVGTDERPGRDRGPKQR